MVITMEMPDRAEETRDEALVAAVMAGDLAAYGRLYDRYVRLVRAVCFDVTGDLGQAQDLCQETFVRAYRKLGTLREPGRFAGWLLGITRFVCREWRRSRARDRHRFIGLVVDDLAMARPAIPGEDEDVWRLRQAIAALPDAQRLALHLFYLQEQSAEHARSLLNLSRAGFYRTLERARRRLAELLERP